MLAMHVVTRAPGKPASGGSSLSNCRSGTTLQAHSLSNPADSTTNRPGVSYKDAGVDIDAGNALVDRIKGHAASTHRPEVMGGLGGFGALCEVPQKYREPVLVSGTDGVGTKLRLALDLGIHDSIGIDLVAMCVNDLLVVGAEPLFFLDYYATGKLNVEVATAVVAGIARGCREAGCALIGGETAEMPGMYSGEDYDLAGFCVGVAEKSRLIDGQMVRAGDTLIALASSGPHSNGYSLIRKLLELSGANLQDDFDGKPLGEVLLEPTRIYVKALLALAETIDIHAMSHITGGGFTENIPRMLPAGVAAQIDRSSWVIPPIFRWLQEAGSVEQTELLRTFNCGAGMVIAVTREDATTVIETLTAAGEHAWVIGSVIARNGNAAPVQFVG